MALQIGFSLLLLVGAGMFVRTIQNLRNVNPGFETDHLLAFFLEPDLSGYPAAGITPVEQHVLDAWPACPECARSAQPMMRIWWTTSALVTCT